MEELGELELKERLLSDFRKKFGIEQGEKLRTAIEFAGRVHCNQRRDAGDPFVTHPLTVASYLLKMGMDAPTVIAGVLHDTVEDGDGVTTEDIEQRFGKEVARLVDGVTKLTKSGNQTYITKKQEQTENLRKLFLSMASDVRVVIIKLADRLHNMRTLAYCSPEKQARKAKETLEVYAPLADRFGMGVIRSELEDLSFRYLMPEEFEKLHAEVAEQQQERMDLLKSATERAFTDHGLHYEIVNGELNTTRAWWPQAEAMLGFEFGWRMTGDPAWIERMRTQWKYISDVTVDPRDGSEWFNELREDGTLIDEKPMVDEWKCPYHNGRMCLRLIRAELPEE